jgi:DUF4097 and DUF4098 domain-containing protein YvlB
MRIESTEGPSGELTVVFPPSSRYVYPKLGPGSRATFSKDSTDGERSWLSSLLGGLGSDTITVSGSGSGLEVWADVEVRVPAGKRLVVRHGVGQIAAAEVGGDLDLATRSGHANVRGIRGGLRIDTGSGHVEVEDVEGRVLVDTGSGHVTARDLRGDEIVIDTGSGHVELERVEGRRVKVDTGSGHVTAGRIGADDVTIDTGSGGVELDLDRMGGGQFRIDTGSGGIRLAVPRNASIAVQAETGSGGIDVDLEGVAVERRDRDSAKFKLGDGAARVILDTGSGGIRVRFAD